MAKQKGILPIVGTLGEANFYILNGKPVVRKAGGGFNSKDIKNKANMQRVRENSSEFGHCSSANKVFRNAIVPLTDGALFPSFHSSLMGLFNAVKNMDSTSNRGERKVGKGIATQAGQDLFVKHLFTPESLLSQQLPFAFEIAAETDALAIRKLQIAKTHWGKGATHIAFRYGVLHINFETFEYELCQAPDLWIGAATTENSFILTPTPSSSSLPTTFFVLGIRQYQRVQDTMYLLAAKGNVGVKVLGVR